MEKKSRADMSGASAAIAIAAMAGLALAGSEGQESINDVYKNFDSAYSYDTESSSRCRSKRLNKRRARNKVAARSKRKNRIKK